PPENWTSAAAVLLAVSSDENRENVKPIAMATAVDSKRFVTRALPVLATGVKNPRKDDVKLILAGSVGKRPVTKGTYHPALPIAKLAEGKLENDDYLEVMLHDAVLLDVDEPVPFLDRSAFLDGDLAVSGDAAATAFSGPAPSSLEGWSKIEFR